MYYGSGTVEYTASQWRHTRRARVSVFREITPWPPSWNWRHVRNPTQSSDAYSLEEQSCQISSRSDLIGRSLRLFARGLPNKKKNENHNKNKMSSDMGSVPDPKIQK